MYYFIVNEQGGSGKTARCGEIVRKILNERNIKYEWHVPQAVSHATQIAKRISEKADDDIRIVVIGGDGTINEVLNGITSFERIKFGVIPAGSGNDFGRGMKIPVNKPLDALEKILSSDGDRVIDIGMVESDGKRRFFAISSGYGLDALVGTSINTSKIKVIMNKLHLNNLSYAVLTVIDLFSMKTHEVQISFDGGPLQKFDKMIFIASMNLFAEGGGVPMAPEALADDGQISVCVCAGVPKWKTFLMFPFLLAAKHDGKKGFLLKNCKTLDIYSKTPCVCHTDGELFGNLTRVHYECVPGKLRILN